jgi:lipopolysaccharide transport system permease protein
LIEYEIKPKSKLSINLKELWEYRELFYFFTWRDIRIKYKQTVLGTLWAIVQPVMMMIIFTVFFGNMLHVPTDNQVPYPIFVFAGLMLWNIFANGLTGAANSMVVSANIIKKIYFPRLIIPFSAILVPLFDFLMSFIVYVALMVYYHFTVQWTFFLYMPLAVLITAMTTFGLGTFMASLNIKYRDFKYIVPYIVQILFFLTPVLYTISIAKELWLQELLSLNPLTGAIHLVRSSITGTQADFTLVIKAMLISSFLFLSGIYYFQKTEYYFADLA